MGVSKGDLTLKAKAALDSATRILVRTGECKVFGQLKEYETQTLDHIYEKSRNFDSLNKNLAAAVMEEAKNSDVCYCVDGAVCEDEACKIILKKHKDCDICEGISKREHALGLSKLSCGEVTSVSAYGVEALKNCRAACVYDIDCDYIAGLVKERLSDIFGEESYCNFISGDSVKKIKIYEIDRQKNYGLDCAVTCEEPEFLKKDRYDFSDLEYMIKLLRAPNGCPWDRVQTSDTIKKNMIEEAYELVDAIERDDADGMEEETGDVLLQAAFHSVLAAERGDFTGADAITRVVKKLIFRHSHVFGKDKAKDGAEALSVWEKNKLVEKGQETFSESVLAVPKNFPACMYAQKVAKRAAKSGMDFTSSLSASERLFDEVKELIDAIVKEDKAAIADEGGDVLFSAVNTVRLAGVDCEEALRLAANKFIARFTKCEELVLADKKNMTDLDELELNVYWERAKNALKAN